jgi:PQQ-dependent catabolism-associated CXXCW motif protein
MSLPHPRYFFRRIVRRGDGGARARSDVIGDARFEIGANGPARLLADVFTATPELFDEAGYRTARYRGPIGADPAPATCIALSAALTLEPGIDAIFIDVMPTAGGVRDPVIGGWTLAHSHRTIAGALWFAEVGRAPVDAQLWTAFVSHLCGIRREAPERPIVVFCLTDCWMSGNTARRLASQGVGNVLRLAEGNPQTMTPRSTRS